MNKNNFKTAVKIFSVYRDNNTQRYSISTCRNAIAINIFREMFMFNYSAIDSYVTKCINI